MSVSLLVGLLPYWNLTNIGISPVLNETSFWNSLEAFLGCLYTIFKSFQFSCTSVSLLVGLLPYWNYTNTGISPFLDDIYFWDFLETFLGYWYSSSEYFWISCISHGQLVAYFFTEIRQIEGYLLFLMTYLSEFFWRHS